MNEKIKQMIIDECDALKALLLEKNEKYGNSALFPKRIFANADAEEQIKVRIDDKLSRIMNLKDINDEGFEESKADTIKDLTGYLILLMIAKKLK